MLIDQTPVFPEAPALKAITFQGDNNFRRQNSVIIPILKPGDKSKPLGFLYKGVVPLSRNTPLSPSTSWEKSNKKKTTKDTNKFRKFEI